MNSHQIFEVELESFQTEVVDKSKDASVLLLFWADQAPSSVEFRSRLEQLHAEYQGKFALGLVDVAKDQTLAQQLQVRGLPSLRVVQKGQVTEQLDGDIEDAELRALIDKLTQSISGAVQEQLESILESGNYEAAIEMLKQAIEQEPQSQILRIDLADVLLMADDVEAGKSVLKDIPLDTPERNRPETRLSMIEEAQGLRTLSDLQELQITNESDLSVKYELSIHYALRGDYELALNQALEMLKIDRSYQDDLGRITMLRIFDLRKKGDQLVSLFRRKMFNHLH